MQRHADADHDHVGAGPQRDGEDDVEVVMQEAVAQPVGALDRDQDEDMLVVLLAELVNERHDGTCDRGVLVSSTCWGTPSVSRPPLQ